MSVHYKFKSALEYDTITFDGLHISVKDLKKAILHQKKIGKTSDFDLQVTNAQTQETYTDENTLIPKNTSLIVARVPLTQQQRKQWEKEKLLAAGKLEGSDQNALGQIDISSLDLSEEDKIKTMMTQSTSDYDPSNYVKVRGGNQVGTVPASYVCFKCHQRGHWIKDCPVDTSGLGMTETVKKSTGIPRSFMIEVEGPQVPGARMTPSGHYAVPVIDHEVYKEKKIEKPPFLAEKEKPAQTPTIPEDLVCGICQDLLQDAVMVPCCGISFCDECIRNVLLDSDDSQCPDCCEKDVSPELLIPNRFLRTSVNNFKSKTGYVKTKTNIIQPRQPSPPRPSLPDFVPPPEYVDPALKETSGQNKATPSPIYQTSPASALHSRSPFQNQTTPVYSERSPYGENSNSYPLPESSSSYQYSGKHFGGQYRPKQPSSHPNYQQAPPNFSGQFAEFPPGVSPVPSKDLDYQKKDRPKERLNAVRKEVEIKDEARTPSDTDDTWQVKENGIKTSPDIKKGDLKPDEDPKKLKKVGIDVDDVSSVSSTASDEPPPPAEERKPPEGHGDPSQGPSYAIPSLFSGQHPVTLPPPGTGPPFPPSRSGDAYLHGSAEERSSTPTVDERLEVPPARPPFDPYGPPPNYMMPGFDPRYGMPPGGPMPYDPNMMPYDRNYRGHPRGPRMPRGRYALRQPPPPGSRPVTPPGNEEEAFLAFQRMLKEKEERDKRKNEKSKSSRRSGSRSRSRSASRSRRSFSGGRSRSRSRSRSAARRSRSRSKKRSRSRSRSFVISRSRSRSYSRSPLHERNYSPKKYYSPHRSPLRYDRYDGNYGHWNQDHRDYRRGGYRGRGRGRYYNKNSPPRGHDHQPYNRYRDENYVTSPTRQYRSPNRYYDQHRLSPKHNDYSRDSRDRDYRSYDRETNSAVRDRSNRRRSHSNSVSRTNYESERDRDRERDRDKDKDKDKDRDRDREGSYRRRSTSRRSGSRKYSPARKGSQTRSDISKDKSPDTKHKDYDREKETRHRSRERRSYDGAKEKRKYSRERDRSKDYDKRHGKSRERSPTREKSRHDKERSRSRDSKRKRSTSREKRKRSTSREKRKRSTSHEKRKRSVSREKRKRSRTRSSSVESRKRRSSSRHKRSISRSKEDKKRNDRSETPEDKRKSHESVERETERRSLSRDRDDSNKRSPSREKVKESSPKISEREEKDKKKDKDKDKDKKKKKKEKEKETEEERAARKKRKKEKKEEKKRKQEIKAAAEAKHKTEESPDLRTKIESAKAPDPAPNFVSTFKEVPAEELKPSPVNVESKLDSSGDQTTLQDSTEDPNEEFEPGEIIEPDETIEIKDDNSEPDRKLMSVISRDNSEAGDDNVELEIHASYESLLEEASENQKKGILALVPEKSKWELDEGQAGSDSNQKQKSSSVSSPERKVTREVIKRAENAIFNRAVNAIREPAKKPEKEEKKERKVIVAPEKEKGSREKDGEVEKVRRVFVQKDSKEKEKIHRSTIEIIKPKTEVKRTMNSLQITVPLNDNVDSEKLVKLKRKDEDNVSPPSGRISVKERLGSKVEKLSRNSSPLVRTDKRRRSSDDDDYSDSKSSKKDRPTLSSKIESIESKRSTIDESHFVPNYDESSDEEENQPRSRHGAEKESKSRESESRKRQRSTSESSEESTKKHKKKKSKSKKKKSKKTKKHVSDSSDSSDSEREKKKHKKSKKKKKSKH